MSKRQTLVQAIHLATSARSRDLSRAAVRLRHCPEGGWGDTTQAMRELADMLPMRSARSYTVRHFVSAAYRVDPATYRYQPREAADALAEAARIEAETAAAPCKVIRYQLAYASNHTVALCPACVERGDHGCGDLGPVQDGARRGVCDGARHSGCGA